MVKRNSMERLLIFLFLITLSTGYAQLKKFQFNEVLEKQPQKVTTFCVPNDSATTAFLQKEKVTIKYSTTSWHFISVTPFWINEKSANGSLKNFYFEFAPPMTLADTAIYRHHAIEVHNGSNGLSNAYTGKDIIIGIVDQGLDWSHPDFKSPNGKTRVLRYWDHSTNTGGAVPAPYYYGIVWDSAAINAGTCTSTENGTAHGTTVAGMATGNARANGTNMGFAPEADLIIVETNFSLENWTLTIADACDYIFKVADTLGKPAVVNLSLGSYLGSHDGNDPASEYMESLLTDKAGRIIVCAAGNAGAWGKYHVRGDVDSDTSFVWMLSNPTSQLGANTIYMDLWADSLQATWDYAIAANRNSGSFSERASTIFRNANLAAGDVIYDTLWNGTNRIATVELYPEYIDNNYHLQIYFSNVDSTNYYFALKTTGSGSYDAWTGSSNAAIKLNDMVTNVPSYSQYAPILNYHFPDSLQTIVSSWNCSEKVISVGNVKNRISHIDKNGNYYNGYADLIPAGKLSKNSSKGPNRHNIIKPDVCASGDVTLAAAPMWMVNNSIYNPSLDYGGWHARNGGTSMASPCVAGIAGLYLEKCSKANYAAFKNDLINTAFTDQYTGTIPNNAYGYGKPHALNLLLSNEFSASLVGDSGMCSTPIPLTVTSSNLLSTAYWTNDSVGTTIYIAGPGSYSAQVYNSKGCKTDSDTITVIQFEGLPIMPITQFGNTLVTSSFSNYQWTLNGQDIPGATSSALVISPPYGTYTCYCLSPEGCISETDPYTPNAGIIENTIDLMVFPNPSSDYFEIKGLVEIQSIHLYDEKGKELKILNQANNQFSIAHLSSGIYYLIIESEDQKIHAKITRM
jgi:hypothetical protein